MNVGTEGSFNIGIGVNSTRPTTGEYNIVIGTQAAPALTTGVANTIIGNDACDNLTTGSLNIVIGQCELLTTESGVVWIGPNDSTVPGFSDNQVYFSGVPGHTLVANNEFALYMNENGQIGPQPPSSIVYKENIDYLGRS